MVEIFCVLFEKVLEIVERFFNEWKEVRKEVEKFRKEFVKFFVYEF